MCVWNMGITVRRELKAKKDWRMTTSGSKSNREDENKFEWKSSPYEGGSWFVVGPVSKDQNPAWKRKTSMNNECGLE